MAETYIIRISRGNDDRKFEAIGSSNEEVATAMKRLFGRRFKKPAALRRKDGVRLVVINSSTPSFVMDRRIYNKNLVQVEIALKSITTPV